MLKLKTILQSNKFYITAFIILFIICFLYFLCFNNKSITLDNKHVVDYVKDYKIKSDKVTIILNINKNIIVNYYKELDINYGDKIEIDGLIYEPHNNTIPNNFNYKKYLNNKDIFYIMKANNIRILTRSNNIFYVLKNKLIRRINRIDSTGYIKAFVIGDKNSLEEYSDFQNIGVSHLFAISGMHVGLISYIILKLLSKLKHKYIILDFILIFYGYIVMFPASIKRTLLFIILNQLNKKYNLDVPSIKILFITFIMLVLSNIKILLDISFIYSFVCVFGLLYASNRFVVNNKILKLFKTSFIVALFSLPINLFYFYEFNILSIIYNIFYIPFVSFIIYPISLICLIFPFLNFILIFFVNIMEFVTSFLTSISYFRIYMSFNYLEIIIYYFMVYLFLNKSYKFFFFIIIYLVIINYYYIVDGADYIYFFDVGQGDSSLIITSNRKDIIMIDTGGDANNPDYHISNNIITFLKSKSIKRIDSLIITHGDYDHMGEAINLIENFKVEKVIFNCGEFNDLEQELIKVLDKKKIKYYSCIKELNIDNSKLYFLNTKEYDNENDNSNVIYTKLDGYKFMFMGDASNTTEKEILDRYNLSNIDVLKVGHHGSKTSSSEAFIYEINPKYSIISVGKNNRYGHPNKEVLNNLKDSKIYRTDQNGSIMFKINNNKLNVETCSP